MSNPRMRYDAPMTKACVDAGYFDGNDFSLVDVGASGGIEPQWRLFEPYLRAVGFDPLVKECDRLNRAEPSPKVEYHAYFVTSGEADPSSQGWTDQPFQRTSSARAHDLMRVSSTQRFNNEDPNVVLTDRRTSLDEYFVANPVGTIDHLKIDTDGSDFDVLRGARRTLRGSGVIGLLVECQFHGPRGPEANIFSNIDQLVRDEGFTLFDIEVYRYSRAELPGAFTIPIPAQTTRGQVLWGDALYLRDLAAEGYEERWGFQPIATKVLKLACMQEIYGMPDCSAELLLHYKDILEGIVDIDGCLDLLARSVDPKAESFASYTDAFQRDPRSFLPGGSVARRISGKVGIKNLAKAIYGYVRSRR